VLCPILAWQKTEGPQLWSRIKAPLVGGAVLAAGLVTLWFLDLKPIDALTRAAAAKGAATAPPPFYLHNVEAILALIVASFAIAMPVYLFWTGAKQRAAARSESMGTAFLNILTKARTQSGGYLSHLGIGIILVGLVGSAMFVYDAKAQVKAEVGQEFKVMDYTLQFQSIDDQKLANGDELQTSHFNVLKGGKPAGTVAPAELYNAVAQQSTRNVAIIHEPLRDVFIVMEGVDQSGTLMMTAKINPLISFTWLGFVLLICGTTLAVWPKRQLAAA
jgi:cytochrome c-type biogenesis protein CcmF